MVTAEWTSPVADGAQHEAARHVIARSGEPDDILSIERLQASERRGRAVLNAIPGHCAVVDAAGRILATNRAWQDFAEQHGASRDLGLGQNYLDITRTAADAGDPGATEALEGLVRVLDGTARRSTWDYRWPGPSGENRWFSMSVDAIDGELGGAVISHCDITDRKRAEEVLVHQAMYDSLTDLPNREHLLRTIDATLHGPSLDRTSTAVMLIDLDRFKTVNDSLGHSVGDLVLRESATRIRHALRDRDCVGRLGGDEFLLICGQLTEPSQAADIAQRVLASLDRPLHIDGRDLRLHGSIGIAVCSERNRFTAEDLVRDADAAMYAAKAAGGNTYAFFDDELGRRMVSRLELERELHASIDAGALQLHYQPQFHLGSGELCSLEALARWEHPRRGQVPPSEFIALAEESDLINKLGTWALDAACRQVATWLRDVPAFDAPVAVNVSARQLTRRGFPDDVVDALTRHGLTPDRLQLEITETAFVGGLELYADTMHAIADAGVRMSLDDFGMGNASLHHLSELPIHGLKIDRMFVSRLSTGDVGARSIVGGVLAIADTFGLEVVAEGIETMQQLDALRDLGCEVGQGYLLGRPGPPDPKSFQPAVTLRS